MGEPPSLEKQCVSFLHSGVPGVPLSALEPFGIRLCDSAWRVQRSIFVCFEPSQVRTGLGDGRPLKKSHLVGGEMRRYVGGDLGPQGCVSIFWCCLACPEMKMEM